MEQQNLRTRFFAALGRFTYRRRWWIIAGAVVLTLGTGYLAEQLEFRTNFTEIMPEDNPQVVAFNDITKHYDSANFITVVVRGENPELMARFADRLAPQLAAMDSYVRWVNYRLDDDFASRHGLMLLSADDLRDLAPVFESPSLGRTLTALNDSLEKTYVGGGVETRERESDAIMRIEGLYRFAENIGRFGDGELTTPPDETARKAVRELSLGEPYIFSADRSLLLIWLQPTFSIDDVDRTVVAINDIEAVCKSAAQEEPFAGKIEVGLAGALALARDEYEAGMGDMAWSTLAALVLVLLALIVFFRIVVAPLLAGIPLLLALVWSAGAMQLYSGCLNLFSMFFAVFVVGLGIDYAIHILSGVNEARSEGRPMEEALSVGLGRSGMGILTGALTTAAAFLSMLAGEMRGVRDLGFVSGVSIILALVAMLLVLPALLSIRESLRERRAKRRGVAVKLPKGLAVELPLLGSVGRSIDRRPWLFAVGGLLVGGVLLVAALTGTRFDWNIYNMEAKGLESIELAGLIEDHFDLSPDYSLVVTDSVERSREVYDRLKDKGYVGEIDTVSRYIPTAADQEGRAPVIRGIDRAVAACGELPSVSTDEVRAVADELDRLQLNLLELRVIAETSVKTKLQRRCEALTGYGSTTKPLVALAESLRADPEDAARRLTDFQRDYLKAQRDWLLGTGGEPGFANPAEITESDLTPEMRSRYLSRDGSRYLVTIFPRFDLFADQDRLRAFSDGVGEVEPESVGTPQLFLSMIDEAGQDGELATLIALGAIFVLLFLDFRKLHTALLAMVPLAAGSVVMLGVMALAGIKINYMNIFAVPLVLGIGIDDGVHIIHRYRREGNFGVTLSRTGRAVFLTSLTTGIGFGSMIFARMQGFASMGIALAIGVAACFLTSVFFLPPLVRVVERWGLKV
jgi:hopanoid biosynthesis associated RND transporter like protein HpnN